MLVDGRALTDSSSFRGIGTYVREVVGGLADSYELDVTVLCEPAAVLPPGARRRRLLRIAPGRFRDAEHELLLPLDLLRSRSDVTLSPALDPPAFVRGPWVQTLHDAWPAMTDSSGAATGRWRRQAERYRRADAVIAVSRWSAEGAVGLLGIDPARLHVIPHGVSPAFHPGAGPADPPYLLFVGEYDPRKRHEHAFAAVGALAEAGLPHRLLVTGRIAPWYAGTLASLVAAAPRPDRIELLGHVSFDRLVSLYQGASALLVTSEGEGFGLPALEAMACGAPVVAYDNSATPEVLGAAGVLVPDGALDVLVQRLTSLLRSPEQLLERRAAGIERAGQFTWAASVAAHAEVLRSAAG